ncbi:alpha/beta fold hydrolase [Aquimarina sp. 2201CG14-23]|uniref:alpha/beta fold hydrolase n=1 Tax=Aquimarina mycalae TaxID=3040073 RepID=UPI00247818E0|nr:alpha/beta hydrolase [Aquimarina sp. 2201CG14-23]MDH7445017.1 alpha/beta hydrolase [Aquimarina sp. 2201CG14-23]
MREKLKKYLPIFIGKRLLFIFFFNKKKALHKAYLLFCTPQKGKVLPDQEYFLEEAEDEIISVNGNHIQTYRWSNMGETILMVHGWDSNSHRWKTLIEKLHQQNYNIIAFDAPAHGNSSGKILNVPLYAECLQKIVELYRPNHIVGHSVGGMTTIFHQYTYPNPEIEKLVVLAAPTELSVIMDGYQKTLKLSDKFMDALSLYFKDKFGFNFEEFSIATFAKKITHPGLLVHDKHDDVAPYDGAIKIHKNWSNAKFVTTEDFGHSLFFDEVDDIIIDFLKD